MEIGRFLKGLCFEMAIGMTVILKVASGDMLMKNLQNTAFFFIVRSCNVVRGRFFKGGCSPKCHSE
jgi:hypothetical protein